MDKIQLYPLQFEPIYQYRLWGGRRITEILALPLSGDGAMDNLAEAIDQMGYLQLDKKLKD